MSITPPALLPGLAAAPAAPVSAAGAVQAFRRSTREGEETRALERLAREPSITRAMEQFRRAVERAPDAAAALRDPRVREVVLTALGLPDALDQGGLAARALLADPKSPESLLARLSDRRWRAAAEALNLHDRGIAALRDPEVQARLADGLRRARWREELEAEAPGLGDAILFRERAARARSAYEVLGDPVLRRVVTTALGLPVQIAVQSVEAQARAVTARLDIARLQDPKEVARLAERYLLARSSEAHPASAGLPGLAPLRRLV
ncbi:MAG: DUF1217 domain-containing protein [Rhodovarius sp.]|nr:DUF1217 domain-containing protein [Rhodovarius sp.]MDW8315923.1 DUF1217 domain-containing protein [Rhodovarius sp.]